MIWKLLIGCVTAVAILYLIGEYQMVAITVVAVSITGMFLFSNDA